MFLKSLTLQNFRSYRKFEAKFSQATTFIVGRNTLGKTNLIEAICFLSKGKSFRAEKDNEVVSFEKDLARVIGFVNDLKLEVIVVSGESQIGLPKYKKYLVNGVSKRQADFVGNFPAVLFIPSDLEIIIDSPSTRRNFLDDVLDQTDRDYRLASTQYSKALRQRNALLEDVRDTGLRNEKVFEYWDDLLIKNGEIITNKRNEFIEFANSEKKDIFNFVLSYDKSIISRERLDKYREAERASGVTLVGPHRDDFSVFMHDDRKNVTHNVRLFGSRGQQRLAVLQLKFIQLNFIEKLLGERPVLLLDDIFSELDKEHIDLILQLIDKQQTIITTTHQEFIPNKILNKVDVLNLNKDDK
jgi:DNA replication and repair protein RecF